LGKKGCIERKAHWEVRIMTINLGQNLNPKESTILGRRVVCSCQGCLGDLVKKQKNDVKGDYNLPPSPIDAITTYFDILSI
jgi:hypothetical protein